MFKSFFAGNLRRTRVFPLVTTVFVAAVFFTATPALAATITSAGSGNWNTGATWVGGVVPTATDAVVIASGHTVTLDVNSTTVGLTIDGTIQDNGTNRTLIINGNVAGTGTIGGTKNFDVSFTGDWIFSGTISSTKVTATATSTGSQSMNGTLVSGTIKKVTVNKVSGTLTLTSNLTTSIGGGTGLTMTAGTFDPGSFLVTATVAHSGGTLKVNTTTTTGNYSAIDNSPSAGSIIDYDAAGAQTVNSAIAYSNLTFSGSGTKTLSGATTVSDSITIGSGTTLDVSTRTMTLSGGATIVVNGTLDFTSSTGLIQSGTSGTTTLTLGSNGIIKTVDTLGLGPVANGSLVTQSGGAWNTTSIATNGTVNYDATGAQTVSSMSYNNLILSGSGAKSMATGISTSGNLSIAPTGSATASIGTGLNLAVNSLTLGGLARINGTWGSTSSTATNQNNTYFAATTTTGKLTVTTDTRTTASVTTWPSATGITYGQALSASTLSGGSASVAGSFAFTTPATTPNAGTYSASVTFIPTDATSDTNVIGSVDVAVAMLPVTVTPNVSQSKVFGDSDPTFVYTTSPSVILSGALSRAIGENVGTYAYTLGSLTGSNYTLTLAPDTFAIIPEPVTVTPDVGQSKVFDDSDPVFTYTTIPVVTLGGALSRVSGENVGMYAYVMGSLAGSNYALTLGSETFAITAKPITITADSNQTKTYGDLDPTFTYTSSDLAATFSGALDRASGSDVGDYAITQGTLAVVGSNYTISSFVTADFAITPESVIVTPDVGQSKVYGQIDPTFTYTTSPAVTLGGALSRTLGENVNIYAYALVGLTGSNYTLTLAQETFAITAKALTLTAYTNTKPYDGNTTAAAVPVVAGLEGTDSVTGLVETYNTPTAGTGKTLSVSAYTVNDGNGGANYTVSLVTDTTGIIGMADQTITFAALADKIYGDGDFDVSATASSGLDVTFAASGDCTMADADTVHIVSAGSCTVTASQAGDTNYNPAPDVPQIFTIKAMPTITWANPADITYLAALSATQLNAIASVPGALTYNPVETTVLNAGNGQALMVHFVPADPVNYNETDATVYINVLKADPVITWENPAGILAGTAIGASELNATADVAGTFDYDPASGTIFTVAGDYTLSAHFTPTDTTNYNHADKDVTLQVIPTEIVALQLTASPITLAYNQTSELTVTGKDQYNNTVTNNSSTVVVLSADGGGSLGDSLLTLNAGVAMTHLSKDSTGTSTVTVSSGILAPAAKQVVFTETDTSNPEVESHNPLNGATGVAIAVHPTLTFSEPLKATTVMSANIQLRKVSDDSVIPATVSIAEGVRQVNITPTDALDFNTEYYFAVSAYVTDEVGNPAIVLDSSTKNDHKFTTLVDTTTLAVTGIDAVRTSAAADDTFENGWAWTFHVTAPTSETLFAMKFSDFLSGANSVPAASNIRFFSAQSSDASATSSAMTITAADTYSGDITLAGDLSGSLPGRQIDVTVEVKVPVSTPGGSYSASYGVRSQ